MGLLENKTRARLFYKYLSTVYDRVNPFIWNERMRDDAIAMLDLTPDDRVLDVGCGTGFATEALLDHVETVHALDQSPHQMEHAWEKIGKHGPAGFIMGDAEQLPYATDTFDVVWSSGSIEYWPRPVWALQEIRRVLKPGGQTLVVGPNNPRTSLVQRAADAMMLFYDREEADRMFTDAGFTDIEHTLMGPPYKPDIAIVTTATAPQS